MLDIVLLTFIHSRFEGSDPYPCSTKRVDFIDLQNGIKLVALFEYLLDLVSRYGIQSASERVELNEFKIICLSDKCSRPVHA